MILPILHLPFNGNANDESGNNNDGTVVGATLTEDRFGRPNSAYAFDGVNDIINCGNVGVVNVDNNITISTWIKRVSGYGDIISKISAGTGSDRYGFELYIESDYSLRFRVGVDDGYDTIIHTDGIDGLWSNVVSIFEDGYMSMYIDGHIVISPTYKDITTFNVTDADFKISHGFAGYLDCEQDDVRIYSQALTPTQVKFLFDTTKRKYGRN